MRTTIRSDSTFVPPVTADRSPPDSRITGADSPVIADSSTDAMPSMISPSDGMTSPASQTTRSPFDRFAAGTSSSVPSGSIRRASVSERILRSVSAWAFPRPSAMASAKFANMTVKNNQIVIDHVNVLGWAIASSKVTTEPTSTTNITGLRTCTRGSSFVNESLKAWPGSRGRRDRGTGRRRGVPPQMRVASGQLTLKEPRVAKLFDDWSE